MGRARLEFAVFGLAVFGLAVFGFAVFDCAVFDLGPLTAGSLDRTEKTGNAPMGDRGVSTWESLRWGTDVGNPSERKMGGLLASFCL